MKKAKVFMVILLTFMLAVGLGACGGGGSGSGGGSADNTDVFLMSWNDDTQVVALTIHSPASLNLKKVDDESLFRFDNRHSYGGLLLSDDLLISPGCTYLYPYATIDEYIDFVKDSYDNIEKISVDGQDASFHHDNQRCFYWVSIAGADKGMGEKGIIQMEICRNTEDPNMSVSDITDDETLKAMVEGMTFEVISQEEAAEKYPDETIIGL